MSKRRNVLAIGDLHAPFTLSEYLAFCVRIRNKYRCGRIVLLGDVLDNHYASFHDADPDGHGGREEFQRGKAQIAEWYKAFPEATVTLGNHDSIPARKMFNAGLIDVWRKSIKDVLDVPNWDFVEEITIDDVKYLHGIGKRADKRMKDEMISIVQGHYHTDSKITFADGPLLNLFSVQVGCGFDRESYAAAYAKAFTRQSHSVAVIRDNGWTPILERMR